MDRNIEVDTLRGLACFFLVLSHVIGGFNFPENTIYYKFIDVFSYIRMPLFTFLSGIVFTYRPFEISNTNGYIKGKFNRLIIPMLIIGTVYALIRYYTPDANHGGVSLNMMHIYPVAYFWFVEAIFLIFIFMIPVEYFGILKSKLNSIMLILSSILLAPFFQSYQIFSIDGFFYLLPFFLFGIFVKKFNFECFLDRVLVVKVLLIVTIFFICALHFNGVINIGSPRDSYLSYFIGLLSCYLLLTMKFKNKILSDIGIYSYTIYLYHGFFVSGIRVISNRIGIESSSFIILICFLCGLFVPILIHKIFSKYRYTKFFLLGLKSRNKVSL